MSQLTANQIVSTMLEDYAGDYEERAGGPKDMWRQGGFKKFSLKAHKFTGKRPGEAAKPEAKEDEDEDEEKSEPKPNKRFSWKPQESLLHELGGHYCFNCKTGAAGKWDEADGKLKCEKCGGDLKYPKSNSLNSREYKFPKTATKDE